MWCQSFWVAPSEQLSSFDCDSNTGEDAAMFDASLVVQVCSLMCSLSPLAVPAVLLQLVALLRLEWSALELYVA